MQEGERERERERETERDDRRGNELRNDTMHVVAILVGMANIFLFFFFPSLLHYSSIKSQVSSMLT